MREVVESIIFGKQNRRCRAVSFGDDPKLDVFLGVIHRPNACLLNDGKIVGLAFVLIQVAPVTRLMSLYPQENVLMGQMRLRMVCGNDFAKTKLGCWKNVRAHDVPFSATGSTS